MTAHFKERIFPRSYFKSADILQNNNKSILTSTSGAHTACTSFSWKFKTIIIFETIFSSDSSVIEGSFQECQRARGKVNERKANTCSACYMSCWKSKWICCVSAAMGSLPRAPSGWWRADRLLWEPSETQPRATGIQQRLRHESLRDRGGRRHQERWICHKTSLKTGEIKVRRQEPLQRSTTWRTSQSHGPLLVTCRPTRLKS